MNGTEEILFVAQIAEYMRTRHFGKYRAIVSDISDPENLCRIKAQGPIFGGETSPWAMPASPFAGAQHGLVLLPEVGDGVWMEFEAGDPSKPIWSGCWWARGQVPQPQGPTIRLLATTANHQIVIDQQANEIKLIHPGGAEIALGQSEISLKLGACEIKISATEVNINNGMVKVTTAGASLVNDAFKVGA
jgi:hypothetical protein